MLPVAFCIDETKKIVNVYGTQRTILQMVLNSEDDPSLSFPLFAFPLDLLDRCVLHTHSSDR